MQINYFNNCATTRVDDEIMDIITQFNSELYFNPSALGVNSALIMRHISNSREKIANAIGATKQEIFFTSGGTESNNMGILGSVKRAGGNIVTTHCEHSSVHRCVEHLSDKCEIRYADCNSDGSINVGSLISLVDENTVLAVMMHVNNETGAVNNIADLAKKIHVINNKTVVFCDGVQGISKTKVNVRAMGVDIYTISGHKLHAPKGIGAIYINKRLHLANINFGGGQEQNMRSGTENVSGIVALGVAVENACKNLTKNIENYMVYCEKLTETINKLGNCHIVCENRTPAIFSVAVAGIRAEVLINMLESYGILLGSGSACSTKVKLNRVYSTIKLDRIYADGILRISFSKYNDLEQVEQLCEKLTECINMLRKTIR